MNIKQRLTDEQFRKLRQLRDQVEAGPSTEQQSVTDELRERWADNGEVRGVPQPQLQGHQGR